MSPEEYQANQVRNTLRAKANIRRDLLSISADRMFTLTYKENMQSREQALEDFERFVRKVKVACPEWQSLAVLEYQKRGACHFHVAVSGYYDVVVLRRLWQSVVGEGAVNVSYKPDGRGNAVSKLSSYMSKYLEKSIDEGRKPGEHRYFRSHGIERPRDVYHVPLGAARNEESMRAIDIITSLLWSSMGCPNIYAAPNLHNGGGFMSGEVNSLYIQEVDDGLESSSAVH